MTWKTPALADCDPGIEPTEYQVLVIMAEKEEKTAGGVLLPDATREKEGWGSTHARLVAVSELAFSYTDRRDWTPPAIGDVVFVGKYPGDEVTGRDGKTYRLCSDREIAGIIERRPDPSAAATAAVRAGLTIQYADIIEPLTKDIEALFAEVGSDVDSYRTPGGGAVVGLDGDGVKVEGAPVAEWGPASHQRVLNVVKAMFPHHAQARLHWRRRPEVSQTTFEIGTTPNETPAISLRLGADMIAVMETADGR